MPQSYTIYCYKCNTNKQVHVSVSDLNFLPIRDFFNRHTKVATLTAPL